MEWTANAQLMKLCPLMLQSCFVFIATSVKEDSVTWFSLKLL